MAQPARKMPPLGEPDSRDPFRYGSRWRRVRLANGEVTDQEIPLTPDDLLDPELGDEIPQSQPHAKIVTTLNRWLECHFDGDPDVQVLFDMKIFWGVPGLPNPSPDIAIVRGARQDEGRSTFNVAEACVRMGADRLVNLSSETVTGSADDRADLVQLAQEVRVRHRRAPPGDRSTASGGR